MTIDEFARGMGDAYWYAAMGCFLFLAIALAVGLYWGRQ